MSGIHLDLDPAALRPLIEAVVVEVLARVEADQAKLGAGRLCYSEAEAAAMLGVGEHVLRDERRRGNIGASAIVGRRIRYTRQDLLAYLAGRRWQAGGQNGAAKKGH